MAEATLAAGAMGRAMERVLVSLPLNEADELRITSGVLFLCRYSPLHAGDPMEVVDRRIRPSLPLGQFHYYTDPRGVPVAFCSWVWLNGPVLDSVLATGRDLQPDEFRCGDLPFFYELLAPFGHCRAVVRDLRGLSCFQGRHIPAIRGELRQGPSRPPRVRYFCF